jgi:hypothetical protein
MPCENRIVEASAEAAQRIASAIKEAFINWMGRATNFAVAPLIS